MTGQIPPYGEHFRRESMPYSVDYAGRRYVSKRDWLWSIRSDKTSERWYIFYGAALINAAPSPTFTLAMEKVNAIIDILGVTDISEIDANWLRRETRKWEAKQ